MTERGSDQDLRGMEMDVLLHLAASGEDAAKKAAREELLRRHTELIPEVIRSGFAHSGFSDEELFRPGYLGLINAVYNVDLSRGKAFPEYAANLIKGEIRQHIRDHTERPRIPAWMRDLNRQIEVAEAKLLRELDRLPTLTELADEVNITEEGIAEVFKAREALSYVSLDVAQRSNDPAPEIRLERIRAKRTAPLPIEYRIRIASALEQLSELQQYLVRSLFRGKDEKA